MVSADIIDWDKAAQDGQKIKGKTLNKAKLKVLPIIPLPPLEEQGRIVAILDEAFAALETARVNVEANLENANTLFQSVLNDSLGDAENKGWEVMAALGERLRCSTVVNGGTPKSSTQEFMERGYSMANRQKIWAK